MKLVVFDVSLFSSERVLGQARLDRSDGLETIDDNLSFSLRIFSGREEILRYAKPLETLAESTGQAASMHGLAYLIQQQYVATKLPWLVAFYTRRKSGTEPPTEIPSGAVLFFEYRLGRFGTGFLSTGDSFGMRTVIGPDALRPWIAAAASKAMLAHGARIVLTSFKHHLTHPEEDPHFNIELPSLPVNWAISQRTVRDHLLLAPSFDKTLARLGKRTRTHLRSYRRRLAETVPCDFVSDLRGLIDSENKVLLTQLNQCSLDPIVQEIFDQRFRATLQTSGGFVSGLRRRSDGQWISMVGGWRQGTTTLVEWQMNSVGFERSSLGTVLRSYLIEQEVAGGATRLAFHGGTSHSMVHAFEEEQVIDLVASRRSSRLAWLLVRLVPWLYRRFPSLGKRGNFLGDALQDRALSWHASDSLPASFLRH